MTRFALMTAAACFAADGVDAGGNVVTFTPAEVPQKYDGERLYYAPADLGKMQDDMDRITNQKDEASGRARFYVNAYSNTWPAGAGGMILPLSKNIKDPAKPTDPATRHVYGVLVWPCFTYDTFAAHPKGPAYITGLMQTAQANAVLNPLRRQEIEKNNLTTSDLPQTVDSFIEGAESATGTVKAYAEAAKVFLPEFKKLHPAFSQFTPGMLRQMASNASAAKSFSAEFEANGWWLRVIDTLEMITKQNGGNVEIYADWRATRDQQEEIPDLSSLSLDSISAIGSKVLASPASPTPAAPATPATPTAPVA